MLAGLCLEAGDAQRATKLYERIIEKDSKHAGGWAGLARVAEEAEDYRTAAGHYRRAAELDPTDARSLYSLAVALSNLQDGVGALAALGACIKADPKLAACHHARGLIHLSMGKEAAARKDLQRLKKLDRDLAKDLKGRMK